MQLTAPETVLSNREPTNISGVENKQLNAGNEEVSALRQKLVEEHEKVLYLTRALYVEKNESSNLLKFLCAQTPTKSQEGAESFWGEESPSIHQSSPCIFISDPVKAKLCFGGNEMPTLRHSM